MQKFTDNKDYKILEQREYSVIKSNTLIQKTRFELSLQEQKMILRLIQMIKPDDTELKLYEFKIKDFCEFCGIDNANGKNYINIKNTLKKLADKSYWVTIDDAGAETLLRWIERPYINKNSGMIKVKLDEMMKPFLLQLKEYFTQYSLYYTIAMKSKYSIRVYELLKSYQNLGYYECNISDLKKQLMAEKYIRWVDFKRKVLEPAVSEINELTDIKVTYELFKNGRAIERIKFYIVFKKDISERIQTWTQIENRLNPKQIKGQMSLLFDYAEKEGL